MKTARSIAFIFVVGLLATLTANGQSSPTQPTHLALEVYFYPGEPPSYIAVSPANQPPAGCWSARFKRVSGWAPPAGSQLVHAVNVQETLVGDVVKLSVSVFLGLKFDEERNVAVYSLHEGERVTLRDLPEFGVEPFDVALVRVGLVSNGLPQFVSKVKSLELVSIQNTLSTLPAYRLALRNLSNKNVSALVVRIRQGDRIIQTGMPQGKEGAPLVIASGVAEFIVPAPTIASTTPAGYQPATATDQTVEIVEAAFDDGSSEGEPGLARRYPGLVKARKIQLPKVIDLFQIALEDDSSAPLIALERLESKLAQLGPLGAMQTEVMSEINRFRFSNPNLDSSTYHAWLVASKQKYEAWLARL